MIKKKASRYSIWRRARGSAVAGLACLVLAPLSRLSAQDLPSPAAVANPHAYVSLQPVPRDHEFEVAVVVRIMPGFHMNANKVSEQYLIPTTLTASLPAGFKEIETTYPEGKTLKLSFSDTPLSVYTGSFTVRMKLSADAAASLGKQNLALSLRYQACNDVACLPPVKIPVSAAVEVAPAGAKAQAMFPDIFSAPAEKKN